MNGKLSMERGALRAGALAVVAAAALAACDTQKLLEVDIPGRVPEEALNNPRLAQTLVNSVIADVECSWDNYVAAASHHSDEWIQSSGNSTMKRWGLRDVPPDFGAYATGGCGASYGLFTPLHGARFQANSNYERIAGFDAGDVPDKTEFLATIRAYGGWPLIAFSEGFCGTPLDGGEAVLQGAELAALAEESFTEAIQLASQVGRDDLVNLARVGRARARLTRGDHAGAIQDAEQVPEGFVFVATRDQTPGDRQNAMYDAINGRTGDPASQKHATVAPSYRDVRWKGVVDPRVRVSWDGTSQGFDFTTPHWRHDKANSFSAPTTMASWKEAQLFIAEAAALSGDLPRARQILQMFHDRAGIPAVTAEDLPTQSAVIAHVIEERRRELFAEGGGRLRDHLKWRGTEHEVPFLGEPASDHPNGVDQYGQPYEDWTCFPVPTVEQG